MKVSLVTGSLSRFGGGVSASVQSLSRSLVDAKAEVRVIGLRDDGWKTDAEDWSDIPTACLDVVGPSVMGYAPLAPSVLRATDPDIAHSHGIWKCTSRVVARWSAATQRPYVVTPHGMLDAWALKQSVWKKKIAAQLYENEHLHRAGCIHALCDAEAASIRNLGMSNPICVIPNGISLPSLDDCCLPPWRKSVPPHGRVMLFLGRLHPKKNLPALIEAWPTRRECADWHLVIAGWDQGGHEECLRTLSAKRGLADRIHFPGPLFGRQKDAALRRADALILPSLSEGLPMAILEAWSYGRPVLQTDACNLPEGFRQNAAIRISPNAGEMTGQLQAAMAMSHQALASIGRNGRGLVEQNFCWNGVASQMLEVYGWLLDGGQRPDCIRIMAEGHAHAT